MGKKDKRVDAYISKSADFAKPILNHLRELVHTACPQVEETIKWGMPYFDYKGVMCNMASFKNHCAFGFWKASLMRDFKHMKDNNESAMGHLGRITSIKELPADNKVTAWIKEAVKINDDDVKRERKKPGLKKEIEMPDGLQIALSKNKAAATTFSNFSPSHRYEYLEWITDAKTEDTRNKRIATTLEWLSEGKPRNWKYMKKQNEKL